jgi:hypothetical protein
MSSNIFAANVYYAGNVIVSGSMTQGGTPVTPSQWTTLNSNIYYLSNVSIGSSSNPGLNRLQVSGNLSTTSNINFPQGALLSGQPSAVDWSIVNSGGCLNFARNSTTSFLSGGTLQLNQYGMVGIQLGNPTALLHIGANTANTTDMIHVQAYNGTSLFKVKSTGVVTSSLGTIPVVTAGGVNIQSGYSQATARVYFATAFSASPVVIVSGTSAGAYVVNVSASFVECSQTPFYWIAIGT